MDKNKLKTRRNVNLRKNKVWKKFKKWVQIYIIRTQS